MRVAAERFMTIFQTEVQKRKFKNGDQYPYPMRAFPSFFKINPVIQCSVIYKFKKIEIAFYCHDDEFEAFADGLSKFGFNKFIEEEPQSDFKDLEEVATVCNKYIDRILEFYKKAEEVMANVVRYQITKGREMGIFYDKRSVKLIKTLPLASSELVSIYKKTQNADFLPEAVRKIFLVKDKKD